ncbi:hypothetical protein AK88_00588 [Plasmodium fragile]|uniref:CS domain-containing protein n=1 Tax=Plasmodium fragile TaxID=5857 RepID=A0A0D9QRB8_PLAFR|nr:uncharacterized protein AK88_00588 [Plasmodium fragile]KJP89630.1 hypothetical protein AK88_00588 [Plasmodium fragile]
MNMVCLLMVICLALSHSSKSVTDHHTTGISVTLQRGSQVCIKRRRKGYKGHSSFSPPWPSLNSNHITIVKRPARLRRYLFLNPPHPHRRNKNVQDGEKKCRNAKKEGNKITYLSTAQSGSRRYYKGRDQHAGKAWSIFAFHERCVGDEGGMRGTQEICDSHLGPDNQREENELVRETNEVEEVNKGERPPHPNEENLANAMQRAQAYIKGKQDDVLERREVQKKKKVVEKLKRQEDVFSEKFLDLGMYDVLKHVYDGGLYADSKSLVEAVCSWMRNAYAGEAASTPVVGAAQGKKSSPEPGYMMEKDLADNYSPDGGEKIVNHFRLDPPEENKTSAQMESLKLYNKKNLRKYFLSLNRGNILKQLVTEGEDELIQDTTEKKSPQNSNDAKEVPNEQVKNFLSSNSILSSDLDSYVDVERYLKSNVTIEFNIYDTCSDRVILNNKNTNSTMLEFPLMYSHQIIQKCILTMKKLEKAIFYINNNFLFGLFSPQEEPMNDEDKRVYDVITNESWVKMEIYLCNIYRMDEQWLGITPETFADEAKASSFLQSYSGGDAGNLVCKPSTSSEKQPAILNKKQPSTLSEQQPATSSETQPAASSETQPAASSADGGSRREEIERRREEYESKKDIAIKSQFLMKKLENEMKYDPNHYMWRDLYPQLDDRGKERTEKYFKKFQKEMSENKCSRGYTDNIKKKQQLKGYDIGEKIEGRAKHYVWQETIHSFVLYFPLRSYVTKQDIHIDVDNTFFFLSICGHTIVKDFFNKPINSADSIWSLTDKEEDVGVASIVCTQKGHEKTSAGEFPLLEITHMDDSEINQMMKRNYCLVYNIYKDNNHKYMWGSIFKAS